MLKILYFMPRLVADYKSWHGMPYALCNYADVKFYGPGFPGCHPRPEKVDVLKVINKLYPNDYPDVVIQAEPGQTSTFYTLINFHLAKCIRVIWLVDVHNAVGTGDNGFFNYLHKGNIDIVLQSSDFNNITEWGEKLKRKLAETGVEQIPYPFSVDTNIFYNQNLVKKYDVTNMGVMPSGYYPLRRRIHDYFTNNKPFDKKKVNVLDTILLQKDGVSYCWCNARGKKYAEIINKSKIFATGCSCYQFPVQKMFEVMACNTLLLCNTTIDDKYLGFIPGVNYAEIKVLGQPVKKGIYVTISEINPEKFMVPIKYYLSNTDEAAGIAKRGNELIQKRHTHEIRAKELVKQLEERI